MKRYPCIVVLAVLLPVVSFADIKTGDQTLSLDAGFMFPMSDIDMKNLGGGKTRAGGPGGAVGGEYMNYVSPNFGFGANLHYLMSGEEVSSSALPPAMTYTSLNSALFQVVARANIKADGPGIPYVFIGFGIHRTTLKMDISPGPGFVWAGTGGTERRSFIDDTRTGAAACVGGGLDYYSSANTFVGFQGRFQYLGDATYNAKSIGLTPAGVNVSGAFGIFDLMIRIGHRFGNSGAPVQQSSAEAAPASPPPPATLSAPPAQPAAPASEPPPARLPPPGSPPPPPHMAPPPGPYRSGADNPGVM